jgi:phage tail-like protein
MPGLSVGIKFGGHRPESQADPLEAFKYIVEFDGLCRGGFSEVSGIESTVNVYSYREGGESGFTHLFPDAATHSRLILKRGLTLYDDLWNWHQDVLLGIYDRKTVHIYLNNRNGEIAWVWSFTDAFPVKWIGPALKADQNGIAVESIEIAYHQILKSSG